MTATRRMGGGNEPARHLVGTIADCHHLCPTRQDRASTMSRNRRRCAP